MEREQWLGDDLGTSAISRSEIPKGLFVSAGRLESGDGRSVEWRLDYEMNLQ